VSGAVRHRRSAILETVARYYSNEKMKDVYPNVLVVLPECLHDARLLKREWNAFACIDCACPRGTYVRTMKVIWAGVCEQVVMR